MRANRRRLTIPLALATGAVTVALLSGCVAGNPIGTLVNGVTGGQVDLGGTAVPAGFPKAVPLIDGTVVFGAGVGQGAGKVYNVTIKLKDASAIDTIKTQFEGAGFIPAASVGGAASGGGTAAYGNLAWGVLVVVSGDAAGGFVANYTVTPTGAPQ